MSSPSKRMAPARGADQVQRRTPERGLAAAALAHQSERLATIQSEADAIHGAHGPPQTLRHQSAEPERKREVDVEILDFEQGAHPASANASQRRHAVS